MCETAWIKAFVARLTGLGVTIPSEQLQAKAQRLWTLIGDVDPATVAQQEFEGWLSDSPGRDPSLSQRRRTL